MAKEIKYRITLLRFIISTFFTLFIVGCEKGYEVEEKNPTTGGAGGGGGEPARAWRRIFITDAVYNGNFGGKAGADAKCMADTNYPGSGTYKAMIANSSRSASPTPTDWVLSASKEYRRLDDTTIIGTTTVSRTFSAPLTNTFGTTDYIYSWTGLSSDWSNAADNCTDWTVDAVIYGQYAYHYTGDLTARNWSNGSVGCHYTYHLICVEQ